MMRRTRGSYWRQAREDEKIKCPVIRGREWSDRAFYPRPAPTARLSTQKWVEVPGRKKWVLPSEERREAEEIFDGFDGRENELLKWPKVRGVRENLRRQIS